MFRFGEVRFDRSIEAFIWRRRVVIEIDRVTVCFRAGVDIQGMA